jgi:hypothetical protein
VLSGIIKASCIHAASSTYPRIIQIHGIFVSSFGNDPNETDVAALIRIKSFSIGWENAFPGSLECLFEIPPMTPAIRQRINPDIRDTAVAAP